jgi:outer membrane protein TolC
MKTMHRRVGSLLILMTAVGTLVGAEPRTLTLAEAVDTATAHNLSLERTSWDLDAKKRQSDKAWNVFLPSVSVSNTLSRSNPATNSLTGAETKSSVTDSAALSLSLTLSGNVLASLEALELNYRTGSVTYELAKKTLEKSVRLAYYSLLLEKENLKITQDSIDRAAKNLAKVQANYKAGLVPDLDVLTAQVNYETLKPQYQQLESTYFNDLGQLKSLLGLPLDDEIALDGSLSTSVEKSLTLAPADTPSVAPSVQQAQLTVETAALSKKSLDLNSWFPTVTLSASTAPTMVDVFDDLYPNRASKSWADGGSLSLRLSYSFDSLIPWSSSNETILQATDTLRKSQSQLQEAKTTSELNRANYVRTIRQAVQSLESLELNVKLAQKTYDLSVDSYNKGGKELLSVQSAEGDLNSAKYKVLSQRYTLLSNILALEYELNVPFGTLTGEKQ